MSAEISAIYATKDAIYVNNCLFLFKTVLPVADIAPPIDGSRASSPFLTSITVLKCVVF